ncbi:Pyruvate kinase [uncultured Desulfatiglans sp.]|uniref:Pyruvate kinase n=1 Tax=Uncultured Desulfatiglans sp. TaxID=1748965 RepID=A0A653A427_UNCDX|nr:Pyruvate kinase [uncultured Desulfatiglans sp.]
MPFPKTKIVCTIGPASESPETLRALILNGMSVARLNFSHGTHRDHAAKIKALRALSAELKRPVGILQDLGGPKIRVGRIPDPGITLKAGQRFILTSEKIDGTVVQVSISYPTLPDEVKPGDRILLADGFLELKVLEVIPPRIICEVITGGILTSHKGVNLPSRTISTPSITAKDKHDLRFGLEQEVDCVALSFVRSRQEIDQIREMIAQAGKDTPVIAKIEKHEAVQHIDEILRAADGVMVARGDLGVEIPLYEVPMIQKETIEKANRLGKPVITATQMLRSMVDSPRPTRAEATDVANAVLDGTDAVMLSEETASGRYPVEAVRFMAQILQQTEIHFPHARYLERPVGGDIPEAVAHASCTLAERLHAAAIIAPTRSGQTARLISSFRPGNHLIAVSPSEETVRRLTLCWGCLPILVARPSDTDDMFDKAAAAALDSGNVREKDLVVITAGHPVWVPGSTNMVKVRYL